MSRDNKKRSDNRGRGKNDNRGRKPYGNKPSYKKKNTAPKKPSNPDEIRLNKYVANSGVCSRRDADMHISVGSVTVNGKVVTEMGYKVKLSDDVRFDGRRINPEPRAYILLNKPKGFFTTSNSEGNSRTVMELVANATKSRIIPVGKLERQTTGLLLFTNDGELSKRLAHPKHPLRQIYHVSLKKDLKIEDLKKIEEGLTIEGSKVFVDEISYVDDAGKNEVGIQVHGGKTGMMHRIFDHLGYEVERLDRVVYGGLTKKDLARGRWRHLTEQEVINLRMI